MIAAIAKSFATSAIKRPSQYQYGGALYAQPKASNQTYLIIFVIILGLLWYFLGRKSTVKVEGSKAKGEGATITSSQAANYAHSLETYFNSGWNTTANEFDSGLKIIEQLSEADLLAVGNAYSQTKYGYDTLRALLNAQYVAHRSSDSNNRMKAATEKLSKAGL